MTTFCMVVVLAGITQAQAPKPNPDEREQPKLTAPSREFMEIDPRDDELRKLQKARYLSAEKSLQIMRSRIEAGLWKGFEDLACLMESGKLLVAVGLELTEKPADRLELLTQHLKLTQGLEKMAEARKGMEGPALLPQAKIWRLDAEILMLREKREGGKVDPKDDELLKLQNERYKVSKTAFEENKKRIEGGSWRFEGPASYLQAGKVWVDAGFEVLEKPAERIEMLTEYLKSTQKYEKLMEERSKEMPTYHLQAKGWRLDAEILLLREKRATEKIKIDPNDDELRKLLKARHDVADNTLKYIRERIDSGVLKEEEQAGYFEAGRALVYAGLELSEKPADRIELLTQNLKMTERYEKLRVARKDLDNPMLLPQATGWRLDAQILLLRETKKPLTFLARKPLEIDPKDGELRKLQKSRYNAAIESLQRMNERIEAGVWKARSEHERYIEQGSMCLFVGLDLCQYNSERMELLNLYVQITKQYEQTIGTRKDLEIPTLLLQAKGRRLVAEICLLRQKTVEPEVVELKVDEFRKFQKARRVQHDVVFEKIKNTTGRIDDGDWKSYLEESRDWFFAGSLGFEKLAERMELLTEYLDMTRKHEKLLQARKDLENPSLLSEAKGWRLDAEIWLLREKRTAEKVIFDPKDDDFRKLLKARHDVAVETLKIKKDLIQGGDWKGTEEEAGYLEAGPIFTALELSEKPADRIELLNQYVKMTERYEKMLQGRKNLENQTLLPQAKGSRLDAEIMLLREKLAAEKR